MTIDMISIMRQGIEKELPSGLIVRIRPVDPGMILSQELPEPLMRVVEEQILGVTSGRGGEEVAQEQTDRIISEVQEKPSSALSWYTSARKYGEIVARRCLVYPKIVDDPQNDGEISVDMMMSEDLIAIARIVGMPIAELVSFRFKSDENVESVHAGEDDVPVSESGAESGSMVLQSDGDAERLVDVLPTGQRGGKVRGVDGKQTERTGRQGKAKTQSQGSAANAGR